MAAPPLICRDPRGPRTARLEYRPALASLLVRSLAMSNARIAAVLAVLSLAAACRLGGSLQHADPVDADGAALRAIQALEARTRTQHEDILHDTQALADEAASLVQLNADRAAEIAELKVELAALRAEVAALRHGHQ
jgi:hypothetical protein